MSMARLRSEETIRSIGVRLEPVSQGPGLKAAEVVERRHRFVR